TAKASCFNRFPRGFAVIAHPRATAHATGPSRALLVGTRYIRGSVTDLLLISDLHLGSHLKPRMRGEWVHLAGRIEETFPRFMEHYRNHGSWQLVINGDFIDFWNVELPGTDTGEKLAIRRLHAVLDA